MSNMPYQPVPQPPGGAGGPGNAAQMISGPAIAVMVVAILGVLASIALIIIYAIVLANIDNVVQQMANQPGAAQQPPPKDQIVMGAYLYIGAGFVGAIIYALAAFGAFQMKNLKSFGLSMASAILVMIPCSICCLAGIPVGIWALMTMNKPEVKGAFR
jgi:hypothetical protein